MFALTFWAGYDVWAVPLTVILSALVIGWIVRHEIRRMRWHLRRERVERERVTQAEQATWQALVIWAQDAYERRTGLPAFTCRPILGNATEARALLKLVTRA